MSFASLTPGGRSRLMASIRSKNTAPERLVRSSAFGLGFRFRIHDPRLPGRPDIVFRTRGKVVFVNGCFWHQHPGCRHSKIPTTRPAYWIAKFQATKLRDRRARASLRRDRWQVLTIWECETKDSVGLGRRLKRFLSTPSMTKVKRTPGH
jgi:DNA mismatch endonuclease (patch repair protein)